MEGRGRSDEPCNSQARLYKRTDLKDGPLVLEGELGVHQVVVLG